MIAKKTKAVQIECVKCGAVVTATMLIGKLKSCPSCDEPDLRYFDFDKPDRSKTYPPGEEEDST